MHFHQDGGAILSFHSVGCGIRFSRQYEETGSSACVNERERGLRREIEWRVSGAS